MSAADTLRVTTAPTGSGVRRILAVARWVVGGVLSVVFDAGDLPSLVDIVVERRDSGATVVRGPANVRIRAWVHDAMTADLARLDEEEFLLTWRDPIDWSRRFAVAHGL